MSNPMVQFVMALVFLIFLSRIPAVASIAADLMQAVTDTVGWLPLIAVIWVLGFLSSKRGG